MSARPPKIPGLPQPTDPQFGHRVREALQTLLGQRGGTAGTAVTESRLQEALAGLKSAAQTVTQTVSRAEVLAMLRGAINQDMLDDELQQRIAVEAEDEEGLADQRVEDLEDRDFDELVARVAALEAFLDADRAANAVFAGPAAGGAAVAGFRGLVVADLPAVVNQRPVRVGFAGTPVGGQVFGIEVFESARLFKAGLAGSVGRVAGANPAAPYTVALTIYDGTGAVRAVGGFAIDAAGAFSFDWSGDYTTAAGDYLVMVGQAAPDAALSTFGAALMAWTA
ncbi:hypothetical protein SAMN02949497_1935 [Methylomagnum ishizawai]|uniref:Uncharacterized protein n=1 Tax=Methylomagnum ishizawai TaxID=1760988 RepID=A0A1Y6D2M1_9GAMM|nr:hypothetical protein [Methylomagnum ishizawai]SMF94614.1 hypothetical protein SAMN02949497_1935 [Methylomagnum ishizawai]